MPTTPEPREEDKAQNVPWQVGFIQKIQKPDRDSLAANSILSSTLAIPMAEEATIGIECMAIIQHQIDRAELYKKALPTHIGFAKANITEGVITSVFITEMGHGYKTAPEVIISDTSGKDAKIAAVLIGKQRILNKLVIGNGGSGYSPDTKIEIKGDGTGAKAIAGISGVVSNIEIVEKGAGYTYAPDIRLDGGGGSGARAVGKVNHLGHLESVTVINAGRGFKAAPSVVINIETQEIYTERLAAFKKSVHLLSDELVYNILMHNLSITGANVDNVKEIAQGILQNISTRDTSGGDQ